MPLLKRFIKIASWSNHYPMQREPYNHQEKAVLLTVMRVQSLMNSKYIMKKADPQAFITISEKRSYHWTLCGNRRIK